jgi:hypothetical protein
MNRTILFVWVTVAVVLALAGCATQEPQVTKIPVAVPCIDPTDVPEKPVLLFEESPWIDGGVAAKNLLHDKNRLQAYSIRLEILVAGCVSK